MRKRKDGCYSILYKNTMITELRRSKRVADYLPITVDAKNKSSGALLSGPFSGRIVDISDHGACLLMTQVIKDRYHVFHSTLEDDSRVLRLSIIIPPENFNFSIICNPIWLREFQQEQIRAFKMGVDFAHQPGGEQIKLLREAMQVQQKKRAGWWSAHTKRRTNG